MRFFNKRKEKTTDETTRIESEIYNGFKEMKKEGVNRALMVIAEIKPDQSAFGTWSSMDKSSYHEYEGLDKEEQEMIDNKKTYGIQSLVINDQGQVAIEDARRTRVHPLLPALKKGSNLNYVTKITYVTDIKELIEEGAKIGWTANGIKEAIEQGIAGYHATTAKLLKQNEPLQTRLEAMTEKISPEEKIFSQMREQIYK